MTILNRSWLAIALMGVLALAIRAVSAAEGK
jgi:hypothetical protein